MRNKTLNFLRVLVIVTLFLLAAQYELGMLVNLGPTLPKLPAIALTNIQFRDYLNQAGIPAIIHASLGSLLVIAGLVNLVVAQSTKKTNLRVLGVLSFITMLLAAGLGTSFVLSGFQNDGLSNGMATMFILTFAFYFMELYALKPGRQSQDIQIS